MTVILTIVILFAMTSAWYTNIVQTSGLVFEAEAWGFDGEIVVNDSAIVAAPGDKGVVHLEVQNKSESISAISINTSKINVDDEMKKRLFFYVDTHMNRNGETMEQVYINNTEGYTYTVFSNGNLRLTETISNAPQLKWQWVYDVLGYYVMAQPIRDMQTNDILRMNVMEYLRPIEYTYDDATTTIDATGESPKISISTVDGKTTPVAFLNKLSATDGYEGTISEKDNIGNGYYAVDVDENGYGVYAYLCNYTEINNATDYDTMLGELAYRQANGEELDAAKKALLSHKVTLSISAQKSATTSVSVDTLNALEENIAAGTADVIRLSSDITIPTGQSLTIPEDARVMVDMDGHTLTSSGGTAVSAKPGSSLTLLNGKIAGPEEDVLSYGVYTTGAEVVMSDVDMSNFRYGIYMGDNVENNTLDSRVHMVGCNLDAQWYGIYLNGNGLLSEQKSQMIIEDSKITSSGYAITGNGTATGNGRWGTDLQIINSHLEQKGTGEDGFIRETAAALYQPQKESTTYIYKSTLIGYNGIALKGGSVDIVDSTIMGKGVQSITPTEFSNSGYIDTADAVYLETNYPYEISLTISGDSVLSSYAGKSVRVFEMTATNYRVMITGGTFGEMLPSEFLAEGYTQSKSDGKIIVKKAEQ